jgi:small conductance mechanosensitive channel
VVFALIGIFTRSPLTALGGASLIVILVAFAIQRFLTDVVAGTLALFENQYGVGDFIAVEPSGLAGVVEELGLRTTVLRGLNGDRYIIPNSNITAVRRSQRGYRTYSIEILSHDPDRVERAVSLVARATPDGEARFLRPPDVVARQELEDELWLLRVRASVPPTLEWLAEDYLVDAISRQAGDALVGEPVAYTLDSAALRRYKARLVVR